MRWQRYPFYITKTLNLYFIKIKTLINTIEIYKKREKPEIFHPFIKKKSPDTFSKHINHYFCIKYEEVAGEAPIV